jgi:NAD(P)-dependent dehydrogenase (short-subunit alcohol dehydrogenase family)
MTTVARAPGFIETAMYTRAAGSDENKAMLVGGVPQQRAGDPDKVAAAIAFMAVDNASYLTGQVIFLDGGVIVA